MVHLPLTPTHLYPFYPNSTFSSISILFVRSIVHPRCTDFLLRGSNSRLINPFSGNQFLKTDASGKQALRSFFSATDRLDRIYTGFTRRTKLAPFNFFFVLVTPTFLFFFFFFFLVSHVIGNCFSGMRNIFFARLYDILFDDSYLILTLNCFTP